MGCTSSSAAPSSSSTPAKAGQNSDPSVQEVEDNSVTPESNVAAQPATGAKNPAPEKDVHPTDPAKLRAGLQTARAAYDQGSREEACQCLRQHFEAAIAVLDEIGEDDYKESTGVMQEMRDALTELEVNEDWPGPGAGQRVVQAHHVQQVEEDNNNMNNEASEGQQQQPQVPQPSRPLQPSKDDLKDVTLPASTSELSPTDPVRLKKELERARAFNHKGDAESAIIVLDSAFEDAIAELDSIEADLDSIDLDSATLVMQQMRDVLIALRDEEAPGWPSGI